MKTFLKDCRWGKFLLIEGDMISAYVNALGHWCDIEVDLFRILLPPETGTCIEVGANIGFADIWGVAYWKDKIFGFTASGQFITIDPNSGVGTLVQGNGPAWWGAAVTTSAPVIL